MESKRTEKGKKGFITVSNDIKKINQKSIRLTDEIYLKSSNYCEKHNINFSELVRTALNNYLSQLD